MKAKFNFLMIFFICLETLGAQNKAMTFRDAAESGTPYQHLDSIYKSALHSDEKLAVFKTAQEQKHFEKAYVKFLETFAIYLNANNFKWGKETRCFNRMYINNDGTVDYFLYNFAKDQISPEKEKEFDRLLEQFLKTNKFPMKADQKFAQCSPVRYSDL